MRRETGIKLGKQTTPGAKSRSVKHVYRYLMTNTDLRPLGEIMAESAVLTGAMVNSPNTEMPSLEKILEAFNNVSERYTISRFEDEDSYDCL